MPKLFFLAQKKNIAKPNLIARAVKRDEYLTRVPWNTVTSIGHYFLQKDKTNKLLNVNIFFRPG